MLKYNIVIIGGGPAGISAALEANNNGIDNILLIERDFELGGILKQCIHTGFGTKIFNEDLTGPEFAERLINKFISQKIEYKLNTMVTDISSKKEITAINPVDGLMNISAKSIILAMGSREKPRGSISIPGSRPAGIFTAGTAQRYINIYGYKIGKRAIILGSGDIGLIMARRLTLEGVKVLAVVEIMPYSNGLTRNIVQCLNDFDIPLYLNYTITDISGKNRLEHVTVQKVDEMLQPVPDTEIIFKCDTLLLSVGLIPENELSAKANIILDANTKGPVVNELMETSIDGIFACGNVAHVHDLVDNVSIEGSKAGKYSSLYIKKEPASLDSLIKTIPLNGIKYILPQKINTHITSESLTFFFRVDSIYNESYLILKNNDSFIKEIKKFKLTPSEMQSINLTHSELAKLETGNISMEISEVQYEK